MNGDQRAAERDHRRPQRQGAMRCSLGPGKVGLTDSDLRFQLTGQANLADFSTASIPGVIGGSILNPTLVLQPGRSCACGAR